MANPDIFVILLFFDTNYFVIVFPTTKILGFKNEKELER